MNVYKYDDQTKEYIGTEAALIDPLESELQKKDVYLLPANATFIAPPEAADGKSSVWDGEAWQQVENHRGTKYWLPGDTYGSPAREMKELGPLPEGATPTAPTPSTSDKSTKIATTAFVKSLFTANKATNGWWKDGSTGIIWQWGSYYTTGKNQHFTFPITFPNGLFVVNESHIVSVENDFKTCSIINPNKSGFTINCTDNGYVAHVIAIGY